MSFWEEPHLLLVDGIGCATVHVVLGRAAPATCRRHWLCYSACRSGKSRTCYLSTALVVLQCMSFWEELHLVHNPGGVIGYLQSLVLNKENEFTILKIASTLKEASVQLETEWLDREKKQRQVESVWLESTVEVERRQRQDEQKYVVVIKSQQNEITDLHQLREENRIELLKRKHESITLNVNSKKKQRELPNY